MSTLPRHAPRRIPMPAWAPAQVLAVLILCAALVGCGRFTRPGATAADLERDRGLRSRADPRLAAEYDRLTAERARRFSVMPSSRCNAPA
jgi:hypothetical protein